MAIYKNVTELVGRTPLLEAGNFGKKFAPEATILTKLEYFNPAGSVKDRIAKAIIFDALEKGRLTKDSVIIEPTSGKNAAPCLRASVCKTLDMWRGLDTLVRDYFDHITLADLVNRNSP